MTRNKLIFVAASGSLALLLAAWGFQYLGGLAPCKLCIWQRWPHGLAALLGPVALVLGGPVVPLIGMAAALATGGVGVYHTGVERGWWEGPTTCSSGPIEGLSPEQLLDQILGAPLVQCDQVAWEFLELSMATWNALAAFILAAIWALAALKSRA